MEMTHYTNMKGKICPVYSWWICDKGYCPSCTVYTIATKVQTERARELVKEIKRND